VKYTTKQIEAAANRLRALPAKKRAKNPSSKKALHMLQAEFAGLLERGYSLAQAGRALHDAGIQISPLTVLESLSSSTRSPKNRTSRTKSTRAPAKASIAKRSAITADPPSTAMSPAATEPAARKVPPPPPPPLPSLPRLPPPPPPPVPFQRTQRAAAIPPIQPNPVFQRGNVSLPKATFRVRPDTPDSEL
jgi:hypothetical protein